MKTYNSFISEAYTDSQAKKIAPGMSPEKRRAALERNARNQAKRNTPSGPTQPKAGQKRLPPGRGGGPIEKRTTTAITAGKTAGLAKRPGGSIVKQTPTNTSIVRTKSSGPSKEAVGRTAADPNRKDTSYMSSPDTTTKPRDGDWGKETPEWDTKGNENKKREEEKKKKKKKNEESLFSKGKRFAKFVGDNTMKTGTTSDAGGDIGVGRGTKKERG